MRALVVSALAAVVACGGGGSGGSPAPSGGASDGTRDDPGPSRDAPPASSDPASGGSTCIDCDRNYLCALAGTTTVPTVNHFTNHGAWCGTESGGLACGGAVVDNNGVLQGSWRLLPGGGFDLCTPAGQCVVTCVPTDEQVTPQPQPGTSG